MEPSHDSSAGERQHAQSNSALGRSIADLHREIVAVVDSANDGQLIDLDVIALRITVLCDALGGAGKDAAGAWAKELRDLSTALAVLDTILRKQNVHVQLNIEHLRKHICPSNRLPHKLQWILISISGSPWRSILVLGLIALLAWMLRRFGMGMKMTKGRRLGVVGSADARSAPQD